MGWGKFLCCVAGGLAAVAAAPFVLPALAIAGSAAAAAGASAAAVASTAAASVAAAAGSTAIGSAIVGAATTVGATASGALAAAGSTAIGSAVVGAATTVGTATSGAIAVASSAITAAATTTAAALEVVGIAATAAQVTSAASVAAIGSGMTYSGINTVEGFENIDRAKSYIYSAQQDYEKESKKLDDKIANTNKKLEDLNSIKFVIYSDEINKSIAIFEKIQAVNEKSSDFYDQELNADLFGPEELKEMSLVARNAVSICNDMTNGATLASATSAATMSLVNNFGFASTGTAISSLSGAAAQRAALASLGGGALSAGGGGMAAGRLVLGGLSLVPTAMIMSYKFASNTEVELTKAQNYYSQSQKEIENMKTQRSVLENGVDTRIAEIKSALSNISTIYKHKVFPRLEKTYIDNKSPDGTLCFMGCSQSEQDLISLSVYFTRQLAKMMSIKVLDKNGMPSSYAKRIVNEIDNDSRIQEVA